MEELLKQLESIRRWRWLVLVVGLVAMIAALAVTLGGGSRYTSSATLIVGSSNTNANQAPEQQAVLGRGYAELINDPNRQRPLREQAGTPDGVDIEGASIVASPFLEISATSDSAPEAVEAATMFANAFAASTVDALTSRNDANVAPLNEQLQSVLTQAAVVRAQAADPNLSTTARAEARGRLGSLQARAGVLRQNLESLIPPSGDPNAVALFTAAQDATESRPAVIGNGVLGLLGGLVLGAAIALVLGALELRVSSPSVVRSKLGLPTLASISGADSRQRQEDLQGLASGMALMASGVTSVAVTSPGIGEGKTMVASNLARYRAALGDRVILVDANLRANGANGRVPQETGLAELLRADGDVRVRESLIDSGIDNLKILPAGVPPGDPYALLTGERIARVLEGAGPYADLMVIDTAAVLTAPESQVVCSYADRTILVLDSLDTQTGTAVEARDVLDRVQARTLGVVLTRVTKRRMGRPGGPRRPAGAGARR